MLKNIDVYSDVHTSIREHNLEKAFLAFRDIYDDHWPDKKKRLNDNMYLYLFNFIMDLPKDYRELAKSFNAFDFSLDEDGINTIANQKLARAISNRNFDVAIKQLINCKVVNGRFSVKEAMLLELLNMANKRQKSDNQTLFNYIHFEEYTKATEFLNDKRKNCRLSISERHMGYLLDKVRGIRETGKIPEKKPMHKNSVFSALASNHFEDALDLERKRCIRSGINFRQDSMYLLISKVSDMVSCIDSSTSDSEIVLNRNSYEVFNNAKISDQVLESFTYVR